MILFVALSISLATATALLVLQYRSRILSCDETDTNARTEDHLEERRAA
jgi:hypothetical protein